MSEAVIKIPGPDHPIAIEHSPERIIVTLGRKILADSSHALILREADFPPVAYLPQEDVDMAALTASAHTTYCPYKGNCSYFSIPAGGERSIDAVWTYGSPHPAVARICRPTRLLSPTGRRHLFRTLALGAMQAMTQAWPRHPQSPSYGRRRLKPRQNSEQTFLRTCERPEVLAQGLEDGVSNRQELLGEVVLVVDA